jgi:hypothetical protein
MWRKWHQKFWHKFHDERIPSRWMVHSWQMNLAVGLLTDQKWKHKCRVLTEEELDDTGARLEHTPRESLKCLTPKIEVSMSSARWASLAEA